MHTSTPVVGGSKNLRKSALLRDVTNSVTSNKRRISNVINQSLTVQAEVDDELERSMRRNEAEIQRRLSSIGSPNRSPQVLNEKEIRDHFQICLKMYAENKISSKNAWNLKIIDYMRTVLYSKGLSKDSLQVAGTSLDVSAKIYGIRVDDIHTEILKLASNMARVNAQRDLENNEGAEDDNGSENDGDKENEGPKKKKKKRMFTGQKMTVAKDPKSLLGNVPKLESVFFQTRMNLESSSVDNLFTNKFPMNHSRYKFMLLSKENAWPSYDKKDSNINFETKYSFKISELKNFKVCIPFADFEIDEWDPDQEAALAAEKHLVNGEINEEVVYDAEGIPIPELDGSIHDLFANDAEENHYESSDEEGGGGQKVGQDVVLTKKVAHIVDFKPGKNGLQADEYCYSNAVNLMGGKLITQVWAGPSHWKLKHVRRITSRFSGQPEKQVNKTAKKPKIQPTLIDFNTDIPPFDKNKLYKPKRVRIDECPLKCTLPQVTQFENNMYRSLMLKPVYLKTDRHADKEDGEDPEVKPYNYENPNDSLYCSQIGVDNGCNGPDDDSDSFQNGEENAALPQHNFQGENLIAVPEFVPKTYIPYALQAKKMDMKKLKVAVWKTLVSNKPNEMISDDNMYQKDVSRKNFSEIYKEVPLRITDKMQQELSCPLAFVALLHLCNEQNLKLTGQSNLCDFTIEQVNCFQP